MTLTREDLTVPLAVAMAVFLVAMVLFLVGD